MKQSRPEVWEELLIYVQSLNGTSAMPKVPMVTAVFAIFFPKRSHQSLSMNAPPIWRFNARYFGRTTARLRRTEVLLRPLALRLLRTTMLVYAVAIAKRLFYSFLGGATPSFFK